jgi:hypothetical protein
MVNGKFMEKERVEIKAPVELEFIIVKDDLFVRLLKIYTNNLLITDLDLGELIELYRLGDYLMYTKNDNIKREIENQINNYYKYSFYNRTKLYVANTFNKAYLVVPEQYKKYENLENIITPNRLRWLLNLFENKDDLFEKKLCIISYVTEKNLMEFIKINKKTIVSFCITNNAKSGVFDLQTLGYLLSDDVNTLSDNLMSKIVL